MYIIHVCVCVQVVRTENDNRRYYAHKNMKCANLVHLSSRRVKQFLSEMFAYKTGMLCA